MTRASRIARRWRRVLLMAGVLFELAAVVWIFWPYLATVFGVDQGLAGVGVLGTPLCVPPSPDEHAYPVNAVVVVGLLLLAQWVFPLPSRLLPIRLTARGRPLRSAVIVAAEMGMLLTLGAFSLVLELLNLWKPIISPGGHDPGWSSMAGIWAGMIGVWAVWAALLFRYWRDGDRYTQLSRIVRALVAGSVVEAIVAAPVQAFASRQDDCYCERGSYTTLVCSGAILFWAFGPGIVLLFLRERYRRARLFPHCQKCGYDLRGPLIVCPECGTPASPSQRDPTKRHECGA